MTCHEYDTEIGDYVDGSLSRERAAALEVHLSTCHRCAAIAADFRTIRAAAGSLERKSPPPQVWTRVAATLNAHERRSGWRAWLSPGMSWRPAAAVAVLALVLAGGTWVAWREVSTVNPAASRGAAGREPQSAAPAPTQIPVQAISRQIDQLEEIVTKDSAVLPDETQAGYQATGTVIDNAIGASRAVLSSEPSNELAQQSLFEALRSKLALLQDMVALINEMRKGNQEGAARIVSGMEP